MQCARLPNRRRTPEQIIRKLRTAEQLLNQGQTVADVCRSLEVSAPTYHRWQQLYVGMKATEAKRLKEPPLSGKKSARSDPSTRGPYRRP